MASKWFENYNSFMNNKDNILNCSQCPKNDRVEAKNSSRFPCGSYYCFIAQNCKSEKEISHSAF